MVADRAGYTRPYHLEYVPLPGGDQAVLNPCRMAVAHLARALGPDEARRRMGGLMEERELELTLTVMERPDFSPPTSSAGRLFDAVSALLGICTRATYEGRPACELEARCADDVEGAYRFGYDGCAIQLGDLVAGVCADVEEGLSIGAIAAKFHNTMADVIVETCRRLARETGLDTVALSGGVMQNRTLVGRAAPALRREGFTVLLQRVVPPNDGGICLGQAAWGVEQLGGA
jgi:hydrogenase maturation protein HypF